jgi:Uma2 family endonuclease
MAAPWPDHLLTMEEFDALPEDNAHRYELEEGVLLVTPAAIPLHQKVVRRLSNAIEQQAPYEWEVFEDAEVRLSATSPSVRVPDVVVVPEDPANDTTTRFDAGQVLIAVEIVSRGSRVTDTVTKPGVYAAARIPHYWMIDDISGEISLTAHQLVGDLGGYRKAAPVTGRFTTTDPFPLDIDLTTLTMSYRKLDGRADR